MSENDTIKLLRECNSGIQMAVFSIDEILEKVTDGNLYDLLEKSKEKHEELGDKTHALLAEYGDETKEPNLIAKGMSWMKTNAKVMIDESDETIADLIVDGCNMGIMKTSTPGLMKNPKILPTPLSGWKKNCGRI